MRIGSDTIKVASETSCPHCWGSGVKELEPFYYIACIWCQGSGKIEKEDKGNAESKKTERA